MPISIPIAINSNKLKKKLKVLRDIFLVIMPLGLLIAIIFFGYKTIRENNFNFGVITGFLTVALTVYLKELKKELKKVRDDYQINLSR